MYTSSQSAILGVSITFAILSTVSVALRFIARRKKHAEIKWDDWFILISLIAALGNNIMCAWSAGASVTGVPIEPMPTYKWVQYGKVLFIQPTLVIFDLATIKISVLFFYKRIFTTKRFFLTANILIITIACWGVGSLLAQIFEQWPVSDNWTPLKSGGKHFIMDYAGFQLAYACMDLALDVIVLSLPLFMIRRLQLTPRRKAGLAFIFLLGALSTVSEAVRVWLLWEVEYGPNVEVLLDGSLATKVINWGLIEVCVAIIAASLPMLGPVLADWRTPESIVRSAFSLFSLRSSRNDSHPGSPKPSHLSSRNNSQDDEYRRELASRHGQQLPITTADMGASAGQDDKISRIPTHNGAPPAYGEV